MKITVLRSLLRQANQALATQTGDRRLMIMECADQVTVAHMNPDSAVPADARSEEQT